MSRLRAALLFQAHPWAGSLIRRDENHPGFFESFTQLQKSREQRSAFPCFEIGQSGLSYVGSLGQLRLRPA